jgi:hypothetical protein
MVKTISISKHHCGAHWFMAEVPPNITDNAVTLLSLQPKYCEYGSFHTFEWLETTSNQTTATAYHILPNSLFAVSPPLFAVLSIAEQLAFFVLKITEI